MKIASTAATSPGLDCNQSQFLAALSKQTRERLAPNLETVSLPLNKVIYRSGDLKRYVYFPTDSILGLLHVLENGQSAETSIIGNDGIAGVASFFGAESTCSQAVVLKAGAAYRLPSQCLKDEFKRGGELPWLILRYTLALMSQMSQTAICNRHHTIKQQLCRWLLLMLDRIDGDELIVTQEMIAHLLGVRREGVTEAAGKLQELGVVQYRRGHITVLDRESLEELSCECYSVVHSESERLLQHDCVAECHGPGKASPQARVKRFHQPVARVPCRA